MYEESGEGDTPRPSLLRYLFNISKRNDYDYDEVQQDVSAQGYGESQRLRGDDSGRGVYLHSSGASTLMHTKTILTRDEARERITASDAVVAVQLINLEAAEPADRDQVVSYLYGVADALDGNLSEVGTHLWCLTPACVIVVADPVGGMPTGWRPNGDPSAPPTA